MILMVEGKYLHNPEAQNICPKRTVGQPSGKGHLGSPEVPGFNPWHQPNTVKHIMSWSMEHSTLEWSKPKGMERPTLGRVVYNSSHVVEKNKTYIQQSHLISDLTFHNNPINANHLCFLAFKWSIHYGQSQYKVDSTIKNLGDSEMKCAYCIKESYPISNI